MKHCYIRTKVGIIIKRLSFLPPTYLSENEWINEFGPVCPCEL